MDTPITISIDARTGGLALHGSVWERATLWPDLKRLLNRILAISEVGAVRVDRRQGFAIVQPSETDRDGSRINGSKLIRKIADAIRRPSSDFSVSDAYAELPSIQFSKLADDIIGGSVSSSAPGRTRLRHPLLKGAPGLEAIVRPLLAHEAGIRKVSVSSATGTLLIQHAASVTPPQLLIVLERALARAGQVKVDRGMASRLIRGGGCLGLAAVAEVFVPGLIPLAAGALVINNLPTLGRGLRELATLRWRLPALYTVIMGTTIVSGQVLAAAIMQLSIVGWYWWSNRRLRLLVDDLLSSQTLSHVADAGDPPVALLDARQENRPALEQDNPESSNFRPLRSHTACDRLIASLARLTSENDPTRQGHERAAQIVPLTFATGAAAALTSDIATLAAVLRPDFATGPSIAERLSMVVGVRRLLDQGWLVLRPEALSRLPNIDSVVLLEPSGAASGPVSVESVVVPRHEIPVLAASRQRWELQTARATVDVHRVSGSPQAAHAYVRRLIEGGATLAVCGASNFLAEFNDEPVIRIVDDCLRFDQSCAGDIVALPGRCEMPELWDTLMRETRSVRGVWPAVLTCNLAAVLGAFAVGLTSLHVIVLTNLGTWAAYSYFNERLHRRSAPLPEVYDPRAQGVRGRPVLIIEAETQPPGDAGAVAG
ncbi:MAG: hypothetical protein U0872_12550 [Planctomycetaceae bacterium]